MEREMIPGQYDIEEFMYSIERERAKGPLNVLIACEESQQVCKAFRKKGHNSFSCDIQECSGGRPEWHILGDVLPLLNGGCEFKTEDGKPHEQKGKWDIIIAHPPCTDLAVSGARWFQEKKEDGRQKASIDFFLKVAEAECDHMAIENPVCIMATIWRKPDQIIQPYQFGHPTRKTTCLWLKGLPKLKPTNIVKPELIHRTGTNGKEYSYGMGIGFVYDENGKCISWRDPRTAKARSKTFSGIAEAMAEQWG